MPHWFSNRSLNDRRNGFPIGFSVKLDYVLPVLDKVATKQPSVRLCYPMKAKVKALQKAKELRKDHIVELLQDEGYEDVCVIKEDVR